MANTSFAIHVDCDNVWIYEQELTMQLPFDQNYLYKEALPRLLDLLDRYNIKASFFIVGKDLELESCRDFSKEALRKGHMLANHSYTHPIDFGTLAKNQREAEIISCHQAIKQHTGFSCTGFRAPGYGVNKNDFTTLEKLGYVYDSSSLPGFATLLIKLSTFTKSASYRKKSLKVWKNLWSTSKAKLVRNTLWQIPIAIFPYLRLPVHASFAFMLGEKYLACALWFLHRSTGHHVILLHGLDLIDSIENTQSNIYLPIMERPLAFRLKILNKIFAEIADKAVLTEVVLNNQAE